MNEIPVIRWTSETEYYDVATGEQITKYQAKTNYKELEKHKHTTFNENKTIGHVKYTIICGVDPQLKIKL